MSIKWYGDSVEKYVRNEVVGNLHRAVSMVERDSKRLCPVDTGRLRASITTEVDEKELAGRVGTNTEYAPYVFLGTRKMPARPTLRPALEMNRAAIGRLFK